MHVQMIYLIAYLFHSRLFFLYAYIGACSKNLLVRMGNVNIILKILMLSISWGPCRRKLLELVDPDVGLVYTLGRGIVV